MLVDKRKTKICSNSKCRRELPIDAFYKNRSTTDGLGNVCKDCAAQYSASYRERNREKYLQYCRDYHKKNREGVSRRSKKYRDTERGQEMSRRNYLKNAYGITLEQHKQIYVDQRGRCKLCSYLVAYDKIHVDHDHETGRIRGLLCSRCNTGIGLLGDTVEGLQKAVQYLEIKT